MTVMPSTSLHITKDSDYGIEKFCTASQLHHCHKVLLINPFNVEGYDENGFYRFEKECECGDHVCNVRVSTS